MDDELPPNALCERCYRPVRANERYTRLGHIVGSNLRGDVEWAFTYIHYYDPQEGCDP